MNVPRIPEVRSLIGETHAVMHRAELTLADSNPHASAALKTLADFAFSLLHAVEWEEENNADRSAMSRAQVTDANLQLLRLIDPDSIPHELREEDQ